MSKSFNLVAAGGLLLGLLASGPAAIAADQDTTGSAGTSSGPANQTTVKPGTASAGMASPGSQAVQGDLAVGAPGVQAKPNTEAGPAKMPHQNEASRGNANR